MEIKDGYTAFCIDEAASYVSAQLQAGRKPINRTGNRQTAQLLQKGGW